MPYHYPNLNPEKALIWRIVHRDNLAWILANGLHAGNSPVKSPDWVSIGSEELISKRAVHPVQLPPYGALNDYVPFYFTPFSPMLSLILLGRGVKQRRRDEIVILVSSLRHIQAQGLPFLFTDMHAYYEWATFYSSLDDLGVVDWGLLQKRDFKRDPDDPKKFERYQAEALVHRSVPLSGLLGVMCYTQQIKEHLDAMIVARGAALKTFVRPDWYF